MLSKIHHFFNCLAESPIELYSEFGLQHELAIFLRTQYPDLQVWLEYPVSRIFNPVPQFIKKEIDLYIADQQGRRFVIELKMPKNNCGTPAVMYNAIGDVKFLEQLRMANIDGCYSILITQRQAFWQVQRANAGIYNYFNGQINLQTIVVGDLPLFLQSRGAIELDGNYHAEWQTCTDINATNWKYYVLDI